MGLFSRLFRTSNKADETIKPELLVRRVSLGDNPVNPHGDGTIRPGDPLYDLLLGTEDASIVGNRVGDTAEWDVQTHPRRRGA